MMEDHRSQPPTTVKEVGIHLGYMRDDIQDLKALVQEQGRNYATTAALKVMETRVQDLETDLDKRLTKLEADKNVKNTLLWVGLVASSIINVVMVYQLFSGNN